MQNLHQMFTVAAYMTFDQFSTIPSLKSVLVYLYFWVVLLAQHSLGYVTAYKLASGQGSSFGHVYWITQPLLSLKSELLSWHSLVKCLDSLLNHCSFNDSHMVLGHHERHQYFFSGSSGFLCVAHSCTPFFSVFLIVVTGRKDLLSLCLEENRFVSVCLYLTSRSSVQPTLTISSP